MTYKVKRDHITATYHVFLGRCQVAGPYQTMQRANEVRLELEALVVNEVPPECHSSEANNPTEIK